MLSRRKTEIASKLLRDGSQLQKRAVTIKGAKLKADTEERVIKGAKMKEASHVSIQILLFFVELILIWVIKWLLMSLFAQVPN